VLFYSDSIIITKSYYESNRDIVRGFLRASARGWVYARENPEAAVDLMYEVVRGTLGEGAPKDAQVAMCKATVTHVGVGRGKVPFIMEPSRWEAMEDQLYRIGRLNRKGIASTVCDFKIAEEAQ